MPFFFCKFEPREYVVRLSASVAVGTRAVGNVSGFVPRCVKTEKTEVLRHDESSCERVALCVNAEEGLRTVGQHTMERVPGSEQPAD